MEAIVLVGIQGSGKSTFAHARFGQTHVRISRDVVKTPHRERVLQYACLSLGQDFIADNTHTTPAARAPLIAAARAAGFRVVAYWFPVDVDAALARNAARSGRSRVPDVAIHATAAKLVPPARAEGFDAIYAVRIDGADYLIEESADE